jgi:hypothetical protein
MAVMWCSRGSSRVGELQSAIPFPDVSDFRFPVSSDDARRIIFNGDADFAGHTIGIYGIHGTMKEGKRERLESNQMLWQLTIDRDVQRKFKARCVEAGKTMSEQVEEMIRAWLPKKE